MTDETSTNTTSTSNARHPDHDKIAEVVRGWYTVSSPEMGYMKVPRHFGIYAHNSNLPDGRGNEVLVRGVCPPDIPAFLADIQTYYHGMPASIVFDDHKTEETLRPALLEAGYTWEGALNFLIHVGLVPPKPAIADLTAEPVNATNLRAFVIAKRKGFANSEREPDPADVEGELPQRRAELADVGRALLARIAGEPAATISWYNDPDCYIYNVATRLPFRKRGIARWLICACLEQAAADGHRSVVIAADPDGKSIGLYQRIGFTDEVYRRSSYKPATPATPKQHR